MKIQKFAVLVFAAALGLLAISAAAVVTSEEAAQMSDGEKQTEAQRAQERIDSNILDIEEMLEAAQDAGATESQIQAIRETFSTAKGFQIVASQSAARLDDAIERGDVDSANHHFIMVITADGRVETLRATAEQASGFAFQYEGSAELRAQIDNMAPGYDSRDFNDNMAGAFVILENTPPATTANR